MIKTLNELCAFQSVSEQTAFPDAPFGKEVNRALLYVLSVCEGFGFRTKNCDNRIGWAEIGDGDELFGILVHLDVVPAGSGWHTEPFSASLIDGKIYGRGVTDDKGPAVACIYAMKDLLDGGLPLKRRVRIIFGQAEETGEWADIEYYRLTEELPEMGFTPDADFPAIHGEKGIIICTISMARESSGLLDAAGGRAANMVPDEAWVKIKTSGGARELKAAGVAAHGSTPEDGENAISKLMAQLRDGECAFADFYKACIGFDLHGGLMGIPFQDEVSGRLTMNAGKLTVTDDAVQLSVDIRYPVTCSLEQVENGLRACLEKYDVSFSIESHMAPVYTPKDDELISKLTGAYRRVTGGNEEPAVIGGGTYARAMKNIVAFGPMRPGRELTEHQANEYILKEDFELLRDIYREAIKELCL
jgi:succinyl-diaminopimelate desuccinylase